MHIATRAIAASPLALLLLLSGCSSLSTKAPRVAMLNGDWKLDQALSEDPRGVMRQQHESHHGGGAMHRHGGGGFGMPGGGMPTGGRPGGGSRHGAPQAGSGFHGPSILADFVAQPVSVEIKQSRQELAMNVDGVATQFVYGEKVVASVQGGTAERVSGWKGDVFVVKYNVTEGFVASRSYQAGDGGKQLIVTTHVSGDRVPSLDFRTVYERAPSS
jgi:hypothetical protein